MPIEPVFDENGVALPVTDRRYIRAQSERYLARQKKAGRSHERAHSPSLP